MIRTIPFQSLNPSVLEFDEQMPSWTFHDMTLMSVGSDLSQSPLSGSHWAEVVAAEQARSDARRNGWVFMVALRVCLASSGYHMIVFCTSKNKRIRFWVSLGLFKKRPHC